MHPQARWRLWVPEAWGTLALGDRAWLPGGAASRLDPPPAAQVELGRAAGVPLPGLTASRPPPASPQLPPSALAAGHVTMLIGENSQAIPHLDLFELGQVSSLGS